MNDLVKNLLLWTVIALVLLGVFRSFGPSTGMATAMSYSEFLVSVKAGAIIKYGAQVILESVSNGKGRVRVPYVVVPAFELREINQSLVLAYDI